MSIYSGPTGEGMMCDGCGKRIPRADRVRLGWRAVGFAQRGADIVRMDSCPDCTDAVLRKVTEESMRILSDRKVRP